MNVTAVDGASAVNHFAALAIGALRGIRWPQIRGAMLLGLGLTAWGWTVFMQPILHMGETMPLGRMLVQTLIDYQVKASCLLAAIVIADRAVDEGAPRRRTYLFAALAGCVTGIALTEPIDWFWRTYMLPDRWPADFTWLHGSTRALFHSLVFFLSQWLLIGGGVVFFYADRRAARKTAQLLHGAELDRIRRSRLALESRLQAMQARVEPQFLLNTLAQVERLYDRGIVPASVDRASKMLDDLIVYLRAAMPSMRDTSSTVGQEFALARAYLDIMRLRFGDRLRVHVRCSDGLEAARLPPMMVLPLIDRALRQCGEAGTGAISIAADRVDMRLAIVVRFTGTLTLDEDDDALTAMRERLAALYAEEAALTCARQEAHTMETRIGLPVEHVTSNASG